MSEMPYLTHDEEIVMLLLVKLNNAIAGLPVLHDMDMPETVRDIHNIQNRILARIALRDPWQRQRKTDVR